MTYPIVERGPIDNEAAFRAFSIEVPQFNQAFPLDAIANPDYFFDLRVRHGVDLPLPDGKEIEIWTFEDADRADGPWPGEPVRVPEGALVHGRLGPRHGPHTIHWHGIEPMASSDGVGKTSFEVDDEYVYQWLAAKAGTYFYHCHRNTVLHFEMGMYGALIIDPVAPADSGLTAPYAMGGPGYTRRIDELVRYDVERFWVGDDLDPRWHELDKDSGIGDFPFNSLEDNDDLHLFDPKYHVISGVPHPLTRANPSVVARMKVGQTLLLRIVSAGYEYQTWKLGLDAEIIAMDGRTLGHSGGTSYAYPFTLPADTPYELTPARRFDALIRPTVPGTFPAGFISRHISDGRPAPTGGAETFIIVDPEDE